MMTMERQKLDILNRETLALMVSVMRGQNDDNDDYDDDDNDPLALYETDDTTSKS